MAKRDHRSVYARRNEAAKAMGYRSYADQRKQRAAGTPLPVDTRARPDRNSITRLPDGRRIIAVPDSARDARSLGAAMRNTSPDADVTITVKFVGGQGDLEHDITKTAGDWVQLFGDLDWDIFDAIADAIGEDYNRGGSAWTGAHMTSASATF